MKGHRGGSCSSAWLRHPAIFWLWCVVAAFGAYACMYGFRKPFTAASHTDPTTGLSLKPWLVTAQVLGYMLSKFIGVRVIAEMQAHRRVIALLGLICFAWTALLLFALTPPPWNAAGLFLNGLALGMVFGLVLGFLEGRRQTEAFVAGLCASFILADGATKSVGTHLLRIGVPEPWMPFAAGVVFFPPLLLFAWMLQKIPAPTAEDVQARSERTPMTREQRRHLLRKHGAVVGLITAAYLLVTIIRSLRADFAPELWADLGVAAAPSLFTWSELWVALGVVSLNGLLAVIPDNRRALMTGLGLCMAGLALVITTVLGWRSGVLDGFQFMVLLGVGLYVPYVAIHTTLFERLIALSRDRANIGYLMYLADAIGYLGYVGVMVAKQTWTPESGIAQAFGSVAAVAAGVGLIGLLCAGWCLSRTSPRDAAAVQMPEPVR